MNNNKKMIKSLSEINYSENPLIEFYATVLTVESEGDGEKRPAKFTLKIEDTGEQLSTATWNFDLVDKIKAATKTIDVYLFGGRAGNFGAYGDQVRIGDMISAGFTSNKKILNTVDPAALKAEISQLMKDYLKHDSILWKLVDNLVLQNDKFFTWPAATKIHHAYEGGLAKHSLNVCKRALSDWKLYSGENLHVDILVAGALLHDIGKLTEYAKDGSRTRYGDLIPHSVDGYRMICEEAIALGVDPTTDMNVLMLSHIILSHHGKLEFGAPTTPHILEAQIISNADKDDSEFEAYNNTINNITNLYEQSKTPDGQKLYKWHD